VWILLGVIVWVVSYALGQPLVIRGTRVPWGLVVAAVGAALLAFDLWRDRKKRAAAAKGKDEGGGSKDQP
jgi:hypothetical protein